MIRLYSIGGKKAYEMDSFVVETVKELETLTPTNMGDVAYVITTSEIYMADSSLQAWWRIKPRRNSGEEEEHITVAVLGTAVLGYMILGKEG